ncbi:MAG: EamA family transporter RarD [Endozoicomonas sp.]
MSNVSSTSLTYSILASVLFGLTPWYVQWLSPLDGSVLFWNRILFSSITAFIALILMKQVTAFLAILKEPKIILLLGAGTGLVGFQWWLFVWTPVNGLTKELSLGYFLLPLTLVLTGRVVYGEKPRPLQWLAIAFALTGIAHELILYGTLSWVPLLISGLYPFYFLIRRRVDANTLACFLFENLLLLPIAIFALAMDTSFSEIITQRIEFIYLLPGLGALCTSAMLVYVAASKALPVSLFGLLSYLEPAVLFMVAILILREPVPPGQWLTYGFIGVATLIICVDSIRIIRQPAAA